MPFASPKPPSRVLRHTDDHVTLGNIQSFYGRMARREGRFDKAIGFFSSAIDHYRKRDPQHPNLARSLANMALAKRGIALQLQRRIDVDTQRQRRNSGKAGKVFPQRKRSCRARRPSPPLHAVAPRGD